MIQILIVICLQRKVKITYLFLLPLAAFETQDTNYIVFLRSKALGVKPVNPAFSWCHPPTGSLWDPTHQNKRLSLNAFYSVFMFWALPFPCAFLFFFDAFEIQDTSRDCLSETQSFVVGWWDLSHPGSFWLLLRPKTPVIIVYLTPKSLNVPSGLTLTFFSIV